MKTKNGIATVALTILGAAACSSPSTSTPSVTRPSLRAEVRLRGANARDYAALLVAVKSLRVTAAGRALAVQPGQARIDLTHPDHAWLLGTVEIPDGIPSVHVALQLDDFGGFEAPEAAGAVDARGAPLAIDRPVASLAPPQ